MPTSDTALKTALPTRLDRLAKLARARLIWERYAPVFALSFVALILFLVLTLVGVWDVVGDPVRFLALFVVIGLFLRAGLSARFKRWPTRSDALRRLEATAGLDHRPLDAVQDAPAISPELWPAHVAQAQAKADNIRRVGRVPALSPIDRYGLRIILPILLIIALFLSFGLSWERLRRTLVPSWHAPVNPYALEFEAWVDPPDYTGRPPIYVQGEGEIRAPVGSTLVVRASGASDLPRPRYITDNGQRFLTPASLGRNSTEARTVLEASGTLDWRIGPFRQAYVVNVEPDAPPTIDTLEPPEADKRDRLVLVFDAADDYGVESVLLEALELTDDLDEATAFESGTTEMDTEAGGFKDAESRDLKLDLTRHPLAGRKVVARLVAVDGAGQRGVSDPFYTTIPDKIFVEPLAKAIVEQRTLLLAGKEAYAPAPNGEADNDFSDGTFDTYQTAWRLGRAPVPVQRTAELIEAITDMPDPGVFNDPVIYLGLRHVGKTLRYARSETALDGLPEHMWKLAIRAEFGVLGTALQEMQEAQEALRDGIARRAAEREIDTLFDRYNQAVDAYMEELRRNATIGDPSGPGGGGPSMGSTDEIQDLLDAIEEANRNGDTEGARRALAQLAELLENMQMQINPGSGSGDGEGSGEGMTEEQREQLEELADLLGEQRELQDQTRQAEREELRRRFGEEGVGDSVSPEELAERQAELEALVDGLEDGLAGQGSGDEQAGQDAGDGDAAGQPGEGSGGDAGGEAGTENGTEPGAGGQSGEAGAGGTNADPNADPGDAIGRAGDAMQRSRDALGRGDLGASRQAQDEAIAALRDAGDALSREIASDADGSETQRDALGRDVGGLASDNAESDLDTRDNAERAREILEELRRRASDAERTQEEQDYLDRLLRRF